jgi:hypothetical protein
MTSGYLRPRPPTNLQELERVRRRYTSEIMPFTGPHPDIPAPGIGTDETTMAWMMDTYSVNNGYTVTGTSLHCPIRIPIAFPSLFNQFPGDFRDPARNSRHGGASGTSPAGRAGNRS